MRKRQERETKDQTTGERSPVYGMHPKRIQIATPEGRWLALMTGSALVLDGGWTAE